MSDIGSSFTNNEDNSILMPQISEYVEETRHGM
jgi:hypothetical protein